MSNKAQWMLHTKRADFAAMAERFHISPVLARIIRNRDVTEEATIERYLNGTIGELYDPLRMKDMDKAAAILTDKIQQNKAIRIVGDYDIDGVCSTYLLLKGLGRLGARVDYQIPERVRDGYGINEAIIRKAYEEGIDTILTCDNGIAAYDQIMLAKELGMTVIVTDHHEVPRREEEEILPPADAVVNPKQSDCRYPFDGICGGVVAYKLIGALYAAWDIPKEEWEAMLEIAAIATIGDVMKLSDENRIIVKWGLRQISSSKSIGLKKLIEACDLDNHALTAYHIGFVIGPCLNASGRLKTAQLALKLLLCDSESQAEMMAAELKRLNEERKALTKAGVDQALDQVENCYTEDSVLVVYLPDCHESLAGIIAGRIRETYHKPALVLTRSEDGVKGSGRSIESYHMYEALCRVQDLLTKFGGHPMAAGFSLKEEYVDEFRIRLNRQAGLSAEDFIPKLWIDIAMPLEYISEQLVNELKLLEPYGMGNEKPQFAQKGLHIRGIPRVFGKNRNVVKLALVTAQGHPMEAILFTDGDRFLEEQKGRSGIDIIYYPDVNEYNGNRTLQVVIKDYKIHD
ncbi:MAG: single-stranded-DNA-specific exonuclease RecJ [Lachnospiraceae bacterium]